LETLTTMATTDVEAPLDNMENSPKRRAGILRRFRLGRKKNTDQVAGKNNKRGDRATPSPTEMAEKDDDNHSPGTWSGDDDGDDQNGMKAVRFPVEDAQKGTVQIRTERDLMTPPNARDAAFGGPPRYDWIDIVRIIIVVVAVVVVVGLIMMMMRGETRTGSV
jgi:hypothetical protein